MNKPLQTTAIDGSAKPTTVQPAKGSISRTPEPGKFAPGSQAKPDGKAAHQGAPKGAVKDPSTQLHVKPGMHAGANKPRA
jgi:hypothetical protein